MKNLKTLRKERNKTQQEVAEALHINRSTYNGYEQGISEPNFDVVLNLADYFGCSVDYLLGHRMPYLIDKSSLTEKQNALVDLVSQLDDRMCDKAEAYIYGLLEGRADNERAKEKYRG